MIHATPLLLLEPQGNPTVAIGAVRGLIRFLDLFHSLSIWVWLIQTLHPLIIGCSRNTKECAHRLYFVVFFLVVDEPILRLASSSLRNSAWNFFSKSFSISNRAIYASVFSRCGRQIGRASCRER